MNGVMNLKKNNNDKIKRYTRKVGRMGNSLGLSLPKELAERINIRQGDEVEFIHNADGEVTLKKIQHIKLPDNVRPEVLEAFYDVFEEDSGILTDLRER